MEDNNPNQIQYKSRETNCLRKGGTYHKDNLFEEIKNKLVDWKKENNFEYPINTTLTPMNWKFEVGI